MHCTQTLYKVAFNSFSVKISLCLSCCFTDGSFIFSFFWKIAKQNLGFMAMVKCFLLLCAIMTNLLNVSTDFIGLILDTSWKVILLMWTLRWTLWSQSHPQTKTWSTGRTQLVNQSWTLLRSSLYDSSRGPSCQANFLSAALKLHCLSLALFWFHLKTWCRWGGLVQTSLYSTVHVSIVFFHHWLL